jgi:hypothetical protein
MSQFDCENLTKAISSLKSLNTRFDSDWNKFDPEAGLLVRTEMQEILDEYDIEDQIREMCGGVENLNNRIIHLQIGDPKYRHQDFVKCLQEKMISVADAAVDLLRSREFRRAEKPRDIFLVLLKAEDIGLTKARWTEKVIQQASELGFELCPPEVGPVLLLEQAEFGHPKQSWSNMKIMMKPMKLEGNDCVLGLDLATSDGVYKGSIRACKTHISTETWDIIVLALPDKFSHFLARKYK